MASYSQLSGADIARLLRPHGRGLQRFEALPGGNANSSYRVWTDRDEPLIVTVCDEKSAADVGALVALLRRLEERDYPASRLWDGRQNSEQIQVFGGACVLFKRYHPGAVEGPLSAPECARLGALLARLHGIEPPASTPRAHAYGVEVLRRWLELPAALPDPAFQRWLRERLPQPDHHGSLPTGLIHGDLFRDNLVVAPDAITLIDFEEACVGTLAFDLGMTLVGCCRAARGIDPVRREALLRGYHTVRPLEPEERDSLTTQARLAAAATAAWRYWKFCIDAPDPARRRDCWEMAAVCDAIN